MLWTPLRVHDSNDWMTRNTRCYVRASWTVSTDTKRPFCAARGTWDTVMVQRIEMTSIPSIWAAHANLAQLIRTFHGHVRS